MIETSKHIDNLYKPDVLLASNFINSDVHRVSSRAKDSKHLPKSMSNKYTLSKLGDKYHVECDGCLLYTSRCV